MVFDNNLSFLKKNSTFLCNFLVIVTKTQNLENRDLFLTFFKEGRVTIIFQTYFIEVQSKEKTNKKKHTPICKTSVE